MKKKTIGGAIPIVRDTTKQRVLAALIRHLCENEDGMLVCAALREALIAALLTLDDRRRGFVLRGFDNGALAWELKK
jgi:hypothetical protein